jgi:hypothetical protein
MAHEFQPMPILRSLSFNRRRKRNADRNADLGAPTTAPVQHPCDVSEATDSTHEAVDEDGMGDEMSECSVEQEFGPTRPFAGKVLKRHEHLGNWGKRWLELDEVLGILYIYRSAPRH